MSSWGLYMASLSSLFYGGNRYCSITGPWEERREGLKERATQQNDLQSGQYHGNITISEPLDIGRTMIRSTFSPDLTASPSSLRG